MPSPEASRRNLQKARNMGRVVLRRGRDETALIKRLIWQSYWDSEPRPSQRILARTLHVSQPYVCKIMRKAGSVGFDELTRNGRPTLQELEQARGVSARLRERGLLAPEPQRRATDGQKVMTADEAIAQTWREVNEWKRKNLWHYDTRRRIRVPIPR